jgi:formate hydrogenlyase subunit 3/multisubunit Na+/H+ antiporter MnhD subunit
MVIYLTLTFFFLGALSAGVSTLFVPLGLAMSTLLIASFSVQPLLYAPLLIEVAVLTGVPFLSPPGRLVERGVIRYLTFLSLGFPFILIGEGMLSSRGYDGSNLEDILPAVIILGFGFAFLLAVFPLNSWIPKLLEEAHPYPSIFVLTILPTIVTTIFIRFSNQYPWLLDLDILIFLGILMIFAGGLWAVFQNDLGRLLGYAVIIEIGYSILALGQFENLPLYSMMLFTRILALGVWALGLSLINKRVDNLRFRSVQGLGRQIPVVVLGVLIAHFSLAGFPLFASFPWLLLLWSQLAQTSSIFSLLVLLGSFGLMVGALRTFAVFVMGSEDILQKESRISKLSQILLIIGITLIVLAGLFPRWFYGLTIYIIGN